MSSYGNHSLHERILQKVDRAQVERFVGLESNCYNHHYFINFHPRRCSRKYKIAITVREMGARQRNGNNLILTFILLEDCTARNKY